MKTLWELKKEKKGTLNIYKEKYRKCVILD